MLQKINYRTSFKIRNIILWTIHKNIPRKEMFLKDMNLLG